jgi:iron complex outermembrane receptor protein
MHCRIELTARPGPVSQVHQSLAGDLAEDQDLTRPKAAVKRFWYWSLLILFQVLGRAADSQSGAPPQQPTEISFEELVRMEVPSVEAASKYKQKVTEAPASITIIGSDEVKKYGYRTLAEILRSAPGLYVSYDRNYSFLGIRGFNLGDNNNRVLLLVDGHRLNNSLSDSAFIGTEFLLDVELIERVEIIRGPGSSLYGNNAFFGVINVITRRGRDMQGYGAEVSGEVASFDTYKGRATYGNRFTNGVELLVSGTIYDSQGHEDLFYKEFNDPAHNNGIARHADADNFKSFFGSISFHDFSLEGAFNTRDKNNPTAQKVLGFGFNDPRLRTTDDRSFVNLKYTHEFPEVVDVTAQVYYDRHEFRAGYPFSGILFTDEQASEWWGTEVQLTKHLWDRHTLTLGGEYRDDFRQEEGFTSSVPGSGGTETVTNRQNYGIYLEGDLAVLTNLHLNAGFRYDQYGDFDPTFNPRIALIYNPFSQSVFKFLYGTAFRAPNFFELRHSPPPAPVFNIKPETITSYELVYEQGIGNHLRSSIAGFYNQIDDLIRFNSAEQHYENLSGAEAKGVEMSLDGLWANGLRGRISYTYQKTENSGTGQQLTDSPRHLGKANVIAPLLKDKIFASLEFQYVSKRTTAHLGTDVGGEDAPGYGVLNFTLFSQNLVKGLELSASIYNLLDRKYSDPATQNQGGTHLQDLIEQDGRSFRVKLTYRF